MSEQKLSARARNLIELRDSIISKHGPDYLPVRWLQRQIDEDMALPLDAPEPQQFIIGVRSCPALSPTTNQSAKSATEGAEAV